MFNWIILILWIAAGSMSLAVGVNTPVYVCTWITLLANLYFVAVKGWKKYPRRKPKEEGWYTCTVRYFDGNDARKKVMDLYYIPWADKWYDERRYSVFKGYTVFLSGRGQLEGNRVFDDRLCDLTDDVLAWKHLEVEF